MLRVGATCREVAHAASNDVRVERSCFFFSLTSRSAVDGGMEGCGEEKEEVGMYVECV